MCVSIKQPLGFTPKVGQEEDPSLLEPISEDSPLLQTKISAPMVKVLLLNKLPLSVFIYQELRRGNRARQKQSSSGS